MTPEELYTRLEEMKREQKAPYFIPKIEILRKIDIERAELDELLRELREAGRIIVRRGINWDLIKTRKK